MAAEMDGVEGMPGDGLVSLADDEVTESSGLCEEADGEVELLLEELPELAEERFLEELPEVRFLEVLEDAEVEADDFFLEEVFFEFEDVEEESDEAAAVWLLRNRSFF